jgi:hypothetical protein
MGPARIKSRLALLAVCFLLVSTWGEQSTIASPRQSGTNETFGVEQAMKIFYGNYDRDRKVSAASLPREKSSFPSAGEEQMTIRSLFSASSTDAGMPYFVLLTYAVPSNDEEYGCHACAPIIGMAVFSLQRSRWTLEASNRAVTVAGSFGQPPKDVELIQIGTNHPAVKIVDIGGGQGETTAVLQLLVPWRGTVNKGLERILGDNDKGGCGEDVGGLTCYENHRTVNFIHKEKGEYYDLELKLTGTDLPLPDSPPRRKARTVNGTEILKFEDGNYVQVSRQGDLTSVDRAVAGRENLK